jgi:hypothetical protein
MAGGRVPAVQTVEQVLLYPYHDLPPTLVPPNYSEQNQGIERGLPTGAGRWWRVEPGQNAKFR